MAAIDPFDPAPEVKVDIPYFAYLIRHPQGDVLFDTGAHPQVGVSPVERLGEGADTWELTIKPGDDVVSQLAAVSVSPEDISHVCLSHLHLDHGGGIEFFPRATFYVQRQELPFAFWPSVYQRSAYSRADFDHPVKWKELRSEYDLFNDGRVVLFPTPGHTPGHQSMALHLDDQDFILLGDAAYLPEKMAGRMLPAASLVWSSEQMLASWEDLEDRQQRLQAQLVCNHDPDFEGKLKVAPGEWYE
jgi:glyoxylase-like metal-dependent hydrolase (beta-lactamase superfamily II)